MERKKLAIVMPIGSDFGWGICGKYLTKGLAKLCDVDLVTENFELEDVGDKYEYEELRGLCLGTDGNNVNTFSFQGPVLQTVRGHDLRPWHTRVQSERTIGYTFFEKGCIDPHDVDVAKNYYDTIVAGSSWCEKILIESGFPSTKTIIQGVDTALFYPDDTLKNCSDKFIIFSGGKLELRKGQDLVIRSLKVIQEKYPDVLLVNLWYNQWTPSVETMKLSPYIRFELPKGNYYAAINHLLHVNGVDPQRVITLSPKPHREMAKIYKSADVGLFPNRCEGGTNLVMMEYMACGKPVIASYSSGHRDVLRDKSSIPIKFLQPFNIRTQNGQVLYSWEEPSLDEIIGLLEWAYWHRDELKNIGNAAGKDIGRLTWERSAREFLELIS